MRIRVKVDITKPLCQGRKIGLANGKEGWAAFKYEQLPNFCYWCGLVTHGEKDCALWLRNHTSLGKRDQGYGAWMKADVDRPNRKVAMHVEGRASHFGSKTTTPPNQGQQKPVSPKMQNANGMRVNMENLAPNLGFDTPLKHSDFEGQLREIDKELGIVNENIGGINAKFSLAESCDFFVDPLTPRNPQQQKSPNDKSPLNEITNTPKTKVGSWKKKTRVRGFETEGLSVALAEKRSSEPLSEAGEEYGRPGKYPRTTPMDIVLAEADHAQLRQIK